MEHLELLRCLLPFLMKVAGSSAENKMTTQNLAVVFGPTLLRTTEEDLVALMRDSSSGQPQPKAVPSERTYWTSEQIYTSKYI